MSGDIMQATRVRKDVRLLFQAALLIFTFTVVVGILNGLDLIDFKRSMLIAHVHAGTLGWITLGVIAACLWMFSEGQTLTGWRASSTGWISWGSVIAIVVYAFAFYTGNLDFRLAGGSLTLLALVAFFAWVVSQSRQVTLTVPRLGMLAAVTTLAIGAVIGVLMGIYLTGGLQSLPEQIFITHGTTLVIGYLILAGMAIAEWRLKPDHKPIREDKLGVWQVALPFVGGLTLTLGALLDNFGLIALNVPLEIAGVVIFFIRLRRYILGAAWLERSQERYYAVSTVFVIANVGLLSYLIMGVVTGKYEDFALIPFWLIFAMDHAMFIGVMTNVLMGLVYEAAHERRSLWPWADHVIFWAMNIGMVGFVVGLIQDSAAIKQIFSPVMGIGILAAIVTFTARLQSRSVGTAQS